MRRVVLALSATVAVVFAVLLYRSPPVAAPTAKPAGPAPSPSRTPSASPAAATGVFTGPRVQAYQRKMGYIFGDVQVVVTMRAGRIVSIATPVAPPDGDTGGRGTRPITQSITQFAVPLLTSEAMRAQSANIQSVSGATYTAEAFIASLQAALLQAGR
jgi:uncharacterized protein with FMN-binding domain